MRAEKEEVCLAPEQCIKAVLGLIFFFPYFQNYQYILLLGLFIINRIGIVWFSSNSKDKFQGPTVFMKDAFLQAMMFMAVYFLCCKDRYWNSCEKNDFFLPKVQ